MADVRFYDPYLEILGGGEKVLLTILEDVAAAPENTVTVLAPNKPDPSRWRRLGIEPDVRRLRWRRAGQLSATPLSAGADLFITLTNHFPPLSLGHRSAAIVQFPFAQLRPEGPLGALRAAERRRRLRSYETVVGYSQHVAEAIRRRLEVADPLVVAPPVDVPARAVAGAGDKERTVIAVGRFFPAADANNKKHDVLIDAWSELERHPGAEGWELHLVGGLHSDPASQDYLETLRRRAEGLAVHFHPNADASQLEELYRRSALFWHAAGYGETHAERHEHFGITTVEAMAHGCVPVVVALGGQLEIVQDGVNGRLWRSPPELVSASLELMASPERRGQLCAAAVTTARQYAKPRFLERVRAAVLDPAGVPHG